MYSVFGVARVLELDKCVTGLENDLYRRKPAALQVRSYIRNASITAKEVLNVAFASTRRQSTDPHTLWHCDTDVTSVAQNEFKQLICAANNEITNNTWNA
jgi:hypothetical protein